MILTKKPDKQIGLWPLLAYGIIIFSLLFGMSAISCQTSTPAPASTTTSSHTQPSFSDVVEKVMPNKIKNLIIFLRYNKCRLHKPEELDQVC